MEFSQPILAKTDLICQQPTMPQPSGVPPNSGVMESMADSLLHPAVIPGQIQPAQGGTSHIDDTTHILLIAECPALKPAHDKHIPVPKTSVKDWISQSQNVKMRGVL